MNEKIFPDKSKIKSFLDLEESYWLPLSMLPVDDINTKKALDRSKLDYIGELLLYCGYDYGSKIIDIGKGRAKYIEEALKFLEVRIDHINKTVHNLKASREITMSLISIGTVFIDDLSHSTSLDLYYLFENYDKTKNIVNRLRSKGISINQSKKDTLVFEIPNDELGKAQRKYLELLHIYTENSLLESEDWSKGRYVPDPSKQKISDFIEKKRIEQKKVS